MNWMTHCLLHRRLGFSANIQPLAKPPTTSPVRFSMRSLKVLAFSLSLGLLAVNATPAHAGNPVPTQVVLVAAQSTVPVGTPVELIATVVYNNGDSILNSGVVDFCDETAASCTGSGLLAESEITNNPVDGTNAFAILNLGIGNHPILVIYRGTNGYQQSANTITVSVTGKQSTSSKIAAMGAAGDYTLNGTVTATGRKAPAGNLSFLDSSDSNFSLGSASLTAGKTSYGIDALSFQPAGPWPQQIAVADFNQDGIPDMAVINSNYMTYPNPGAYLQILYGDGKGGTTYITSVTLPETDGIAVGEFDGSGIPMIAVSD